MALLQAPTLQRLIREARIFLNQLDPTSSFWSDEELTNYANDAVAQYFQIVNNEAEGQFDTSATLDVTAGTETVALPSDCFEVRSVYAVQPNQNTMLRYVNNLTESYETSNTNNSSTYAPYYYFQGSNLVLRPIPQFTQTGFLKLEYTAFPQSMIVGGDSMTAGISPIFKELVVKYMAYQAKLKEASVMGGDSHVAIQTHLNGLVAQFKLNVGGRSKYPQYVIPFEP